MERAWSEAGLSRRPNNSLAASLGLSGLASGGSGFGFTEPLSWAIAVPARRKLAVSVRRRIVFMLEG
jgi:hypothetical protein